MTARQVVALTIVLVLAILAAISIIRPHLPEPAIHTMHVIGLVLGRPTC